jgi:hypothetical protein
LGYVLIIDRVPRRIFRPPDAIADVARNPGTRWHLVRGEILPLPPLGSDAVTLPQPLALPAGREAVVTRVDIEEIYAFGRPALETIEYARNFFIADGTAGALLRIAAGRRAHPDSELRLGAAFVEQSLEPNPGALSRAAFLRAMRVGDPVYVYGRAHSEPDHAGLAAAGYREAPLIAVFDAERGPLYVYDEAAFRQLTAWHALPWYRKLSVLVRNR